MRSFKAIIVAGIFAWLAMPLSARAETACDVRFSLGRDIPVNTIDQLRADTETFLHDIDECWANKAFHEKTDGFQFSSRANELRLDLKDPKLTSDHAYDLLHDFLVSLHDGHLTFADPRTSISLFSGVDILETKTGLAIVRCTETCGDLKLPLVIRKIDGIDASTWLRTRAEWSTGSTSQGRRHHAVESLSSTFHPQDSKARADETAQRLTVVDANGTEHEIKLNWSGKIPAWEFERLNAPCVSSYMRGDTFVLRIEDFFCASADEPRITMVDRLQSIFSNAPEFSKILIDMRGNVGGLAPGAEWLVSRLTESPKTFYYATSVFGSGQPLFDEEIPRLASTDAEDKSFRKKPLWILADGGCFSQCSILSAALVNSGRAKLVGSAVDPGAGGPTYWRAPRGLWGANLPITTVTGKDHTPIEGSTLGPILPAPVELQNALGNDPVLDSALRAILKR